MLYRSMRPKQNNKQPWTIYNCKTTYNISNPRPRQYKITMETVFLKHSPSFKKL